MTFNEDGLNIDTLAQILQTKITEYRNVYGADINVEPNSPDGQALSIESKTVADLQELFLSHYNSLDPDRAQGQQLNRLLKFFILTRNAATRSTVDVQITASATFAIPVNYSIRDTLGQNWIVVAPQTIPSGNTTLSFRAENYGAVAAAANTVNQPNLVYTEITSVTNPAVANVGRNEETDEDARVRFQQIKEINAKSVLAAIFSNVRNVTGVTDVQVYENDSDQADTVRDMVPHSFWVVAEGGAIADIGQAIITRKSGGAPLKGAVAGVYNEPLEGGGTIPRTFRFDRPTVVNPYIRFNVRKRNPTDVIDEDLIKSELAKRTFTIAQNMIVTELYSNIYYPNNNFFADELEVSSDNVTYVDDRLESGFAEKFVIDVSRITITEV